MLDQPTAPVEGATVLVEVDDGVATLTLNRPHRRNSVCWRLFGDLVAALEQVREDPHVRVVVLTGSGNDFCVGADLDRMTSNDQRDKDTRTLRGRSREDDLQRLTFASRAAEILVSCPKPTIAKVNGACAGAGLSLALAADFRLAAPGIAINTAFVSAGVSGDLGSAWLLSRAVGDARARVLLLDPVKISAEEAAAIGIITEVTTDLDARVAELADKLARQAPVAMAFAKDNLTDAATLAFPEYLRREAPRMVDSAASNNPQQRASGPLGDRGTQYSAGETR